MKFFLSIDALSKIINILCCFLKIISYFLFGKSISLVIMSKNEGY